MAKLSGKYLAEYNAVRRYIKRRAKKCEALTDALRAASYHPRRLSTEADYADNVTGGYTESTVIFKHEKY